MPMDPIPDIASLSLAEIARLVEEAKLPPVEKWNPTHCGDSEMRIARDGTWYHQGSPIGRPAMVRLFSTILRREADGSHVLVTPVEKLDIVVEDAPAGITAGLAGGMATLGVARLDDAEGLRAAGAHRVVASLDEVPLKKRTSFTVRRPAA